MKYLLSGLLLLQVGLTSLCAQKAVNGVVVYENAKGKLLAIPFANVYWQGTNFGTSTDTNGVFRLAVPDKASKLIVSSIGYKSDTISVERFDKSISVVLKSANTTLGTVEVEYRRKSSEMSFINPIQTINMNEKELFKAACCNLSESFETNPSVDVNFTDAVTGTRQIRMLGLNGPYTMISRENMPGIRGASNLFGLSYIPGFWVKSIQVTKGVGSVVNGFESIAGQINVELAKPETEEETSLNLFANQGGRVEANFIHKEHFSEKVSSALLLHANTRFVEADRNNDQFRDFPLQDQVNVLNRWKFNSQKGWMGQLGVHFIADDKEGGQTDEFISENKNRLFREEPYLININTESVELFGKVGYVFSDFKYKSMGFQWSVKQHDQTSNFGARNYDIKHKSAYFNWIYQSIIVNTNHQFKTGLSFVYDEYDEQFQQLNFDRIERTRGGFFEYTYKPNNLFTMVAGLRGDYHNFYGGFLTPRVHLRYAPNESTVLRAVGGSGQRSPTTLIDNQSLMASSRTFVFFQNRAKGAYGLEMEKAWNLGFNVTKSFSLDYREGVIQADFYRTTFENQIVVDRDFSSDRLLMYNLAGKSFSNTAQVQVDYELIKFLDVRVAYRWVQVETENSIGLQQQAFTPKHRFFINFGYETARNNKKANWMFDATAQWIGKQRIPSTENNSAENRRALNSPDYVLLSGQVTRNFSDRLAVYIGVENALNYQQANPIIDADNPFGNEFDASMIWGPIFGRNIYGGLRWKLNKSKDND